MDATKVGARRTILAWLRRHRLSLAGLPPVTRGLAIGGLLVASTSVVTILLLALRAAPLNGVCRAGVAAAPVDLGLSMAAARSGWRYPRVRFTLLGSIALVPPILVTLLYPYRPWTARGWWSAPLILTLPIGAIALLCGTWAGTGFRGPRRPARLILVLALPFASVPVAAVAAGLGFRDLCRTPRMLGEPALVYGAVSGSAAIAMLLWLAVDGLRLSGDLGDWLFRRFSEVRVANAILLVKALGALAVLVLALAGATSRLGPVSQLWTLLAGALPATALVFALLIWERQLVGVSADRFSAVVQLIGVAVALWLGPLILTYSFPVFDTVLESRRPWAIAVGALVAVAVLVGLTYRHRAALPWRVLIGVAVLATAVGLSWAALHPLSEPGQTPIRLQLTVPQLTAVVVGPALFVLVGLGVLAFRKRFRHLRAFIIAFWVWLLLTQVVPDLVPFLNVTAVGLDASVFVVAAILFLIARTGRRHPVSSREIALLLITLAVLLELPFLVGLLGRPVVGALSVLALLGPGVTTLTLAAEPLNRDGADRPARVLGTIGALCLAYGLLLSVAIGGKGPLLEIQGISESFQGYFTLPLAVVLVAAHSVKAQLGQGAAPPVAT
jgi:hypothetical protein